MMRGMTVYYVSRVVFSICCALLLLVTGMAGWLAAILGLVLIGLFIWAPRSGRYSVHPELGLTALRRDERTAAINDKAARNAFVVTVLILAAILIYGHSSALTAIPTSAIELSMVAATVAYFTSDLFLRRAGN